jgi:phosphoglycolate phosphatase
MARLHFGQVTFDADLVVLDKDGTLIEFDAMWGRLAEFWVRRLAGGTGERALVAALYRALGYDPDRRRTDPQGPLAIATTGQVQALVAGTLYRYGATWPEAEDRARAAFQSGAELPLASLVRPAGDVRGLLLRLQAAGVRAAVVTTDHRAETEETLRLLDIAGLVAGLVCGDDGLPSKPAPDMLLAICERLGVAPAHTAVVGDTTGDLLMAQRAGAGLRVAVLTGAGDRASLASHADVLLGSIDEVSVPEVPPVVAGTEGEP